MGLCVKDALIGWSEVCMSHEPVVVVVCYCCVYFWRFDDKAVRCVRGTHVVSTVRHAGVDGQEAVMVVLLDHHCGSTSGSPGTARGSPSTPHRHTGARPTRQPTRDSQ